MADRYVYPSLEALRKLEESLAGHFCEQQPPAADEVRRQCASPMSWLAQTWSSRPDRVELQMGLLLWWPRLRKLVLVGGGLGALAVLALGALWWRLSSGPIELDMATPWLTAAIKENLGGGHQVEVGGTQLERDINGRTSLRIRDIVVRDADGSIVASAPKAEVGISGLGLFTGRIRAERLSLVGAEMAVRIESDSRLTVFAGSYKHPFVTAAAGSTPIITGSGSASLPSRSAAVQGVPSSSGVRGGAADFAAVLAWIESLDAGGLDGGDLAEIGLKGGNLIVDDQRNGKQWTFSNIDLSVMRPKAGGIAVMLGSEAVERPWLMRATITPGQKGHRIIDMEAQKVSAKDLVLAARVGLDPYEPDLTLSGRIRADIGPDGIPRMVDGRMIVDKGVIHDHEDPEALIAIDRAEISLDWDASRQALMMPFQVLSGGNRITLLAQAEPPRETGAPWTLRASGGTIVLGETNPLILNRIAVRLRLDPKKQLIDIEQGELGNMDLGIALSGGLDFSLEDPRLAIGVAGTRMPVTTLKRLWPIFCAPKVRSWVLDHVHSGTVERLMVTTNAPWSTLRSSGPPIPEDGLAIEIVGHSAEIRPVAGLPGIRDADVNVRISGRHATINVGRGNVEISPGRKLSITNGVFEVPDTFPKAPPAKVRFRLDGSVPAAAELLANERLREHSGSPLDAATTRGTLTAQVTLALPLKRDLAPGSSIYTINLDVLNFAAERMVMGQKVEAALLKVTANNHGYWIRGDVKLHGVPAVLDYRKPSDGDAEVRLQATVDENARNKLGVDLNGILAGAVPIKLQGRIASREGDSRFAVEADLTQAKIDNLFPGWSKAAGRNSRASFTLICKSSSTRFEDLVLEAPGTAVKGMVEIDSSGELLTATLPVFQLAEGDKSSLRAERAPDGTLRITMRGELFDGRGFLKSSLTGPANAKQKNDKDVDLDLKIGTVLGFHGETLRGIDVRLSRRANTITALNLNAKLGRHTPLIGDLRGRGSAGRPVVFLETNDAGAFFRFSDIYPKIFGGEMWVALDPQSADRAPQEGILNIRDFAVRGEAALDRVAGASTQQGVDFSRLRVDFTRSLGRFTIRDGLVKGPMIGATVDGYVDYHNSDVRMRGTFVPLYSLNNMFGQIPIFGLFLGGSNEGLLGVTYEVVGQPSTPVLRVNPISAIAPGLLRKFFEFPSGNSPAPQSYADPARN